MCVSLCVCLCVCVCVFGGWVVANRNACVVSDLDILSMTIGTVPNDICQGLLGFGFGLWMAWKQCALTVYSPYVTLWNYTTLYPNARSYLLSRGRELGFACWGSAVIGGVGDLSIAFGCLLHLMRLQHETNSYSDL